MSRVLSIRMRDDQAERLGRLARRHGYSLGEAGGRLIEEALRMADFSFIIFRDSSVGRQAYIQGSGLAVWEVMMIARAYDGDAAKTAEHLGWPVTRVQAAFNYAAAYPGEIEDALRDNDSYDAEKITRMLLRTKVFSASAAVASKELPTRATPAAG